MFLNTLAVIKRGCCHVFLKVACRVRVWKKPFCQNSNKFGRSFIKSDIMVMYLLCIYKKRIILIVKGKPKTNTLKSILKTQTSLKQIPTNILLTVQDDSFPL